MMEKVPVAKRPVFTHLAVIPDDLLEDLPVGVITREAVDQHLGLPTALHGILEQPDGHLHRPYSGTGCTCRVHGGRVGRDRLMP